MKIDKEYKRCMLFNLKLLNAIKNGDTSILKEAKELGPTLELDELKMIKRSVLETIKRAEELLNDEEMPLLFDIIGSLNLVESKVMKHKIMLKKANSEGTIIDAINTVIESEYGDEVREEDLFLLYSYIIQKALFINNQEMIDKVYKKIEELEEKA